MADTEDLTFTVEGPDGDTSDLTVPRGLVDLLSEPGESPATVVADVALMAFVGRAHAVVHHQEDDPDPGMVEMEARARELFEERFGITYGEATGHEH